MMIHISADALITIAAQYGPDGRTWITELAKTAIATAEDGPYPIEFITIQLVDSEVITTAHRRPIIAVNR